jgi:hypothetical protein
MTELLNVFVGLFLVYLFFAVVVSAVQEWWSQYFGHRGRFLQLGLARMLADEAVYVRVLQHPLIGGLYRDRAARGKPPAYVEPLHFAMAFANVLIRRDANAAGGADAAQPPVPPELNFANLRAAVCRLAGQRSPIAYAALPIIDKAEGDLQLALHGLADWYSATMDRVGGWYKAYAQRRLFVFGLLLAAIANVDTIRIFSALNHSSAASAQIALPTRLPIGYACMADAFPAMDARPSETAWTRCADDLHRAVNTSTFSDGLLRVFGWMLTALAGVIGAPYWFSALAKIVNLRGSGAKPDPRKPFAGQ